MLGCSGLVSILPMSSPLPFNAKPDPARDKNISTSSTSQPTFISYTQLLYHKKGIITDRIKILRNHSVWMRSRCRADSSIANTTNIYHTFWHTQRKFVLIDKYCLIELLISRLFYRRFHECQYSCPLRSRPKTRQVALNLPCLPLDGVRTLLAWPLYVFDLVL